MTTSPQLKVTDDRFLTRSQSGAIWGSVYFEVDGTAFPDCGWTDLVAGFLAAWLEALTRIARGSSSKERVQFMDGPFAVDISAAGNDLLELAFLHNEVVTRAAEGNAIDLLENAIAVSQQLVANFQERGWSGRDVNNLKAAAGRGKKVLRTPRGSA